MIVHSASNENPELRPDGYFAKIRSTLKRREDGQIDTGHLWARLRKDITGIEQAEPEKINPSASFSHMLSGYDSQYYSYLLSLVYACDMFSEFEEAGIMNQEIGRKYVDTVLKPGASRGGKSIVRDFLGREPNDKAFLRMKGLD